MTLSTLKVLWWVLCLSGTGEREVGGRVLWVSYVLSRRPWTGGGLGREGGVRGSGVRHGPGLVRWEDEMVGVLVWETDGHRVLRGSSGEDETGLRATEGTYSTFGDEGPEREDGAPGSFK